VDLDPAYLITMDKRITLLWEVPDLSVVLIWGFNYAYVA
jgi:hypothetical protein